MRNQSTEFDAGLDAFRIRQEAAEDRAAAAFEARQDADAAEIRRLRDMLYRYEQLLDSKDKLIGILSGQLDTMTQTMQEASRAIDALRCWQ